MSALPWLLALFCGPFFPAAEEKPVPEQLPLPSDVTLPPGAVMRLGSPRWQHGDRISAVAYSQDGKRLASAVLGAELVRIWDAESGNVLHDIPLTEVDMLALSQDGKSLAAIGRDWSGADPGVWLWKEGAAPPLQFLKPSPDALCLLFHGNRLWIGRRNGLAFSDTDGKPAVVDYRYATPLRVNALAVTGGSRPQLAAATHEGIFLADGEGKRIDHAAVGEKETATRVAFAPNGKSVAVGTNDGVLYVWSIRGDTLVKRFTIRPHRTGVLSIAFSPDGKQLISVGEGGEILRSDAETGDKISTVVAKGSERAAEKATDIPPLVLSPDGTRLAGRFGQIKGEFDSGLHVWNTLNGGELSVHRGPGEAIQKMVFQSDGSLATFSTAGELIVWNTKLGRDVRRELLLGYGLDKSSLSADGRMILCRDESSIEVSNFMTHSRPVLLSKERKKIYGAALSPDPNLLVTSYSGSVGFWSVKDQTVTEVDTPLKRFSTLAFSGNGKRLILADGERVQVWNITPRKKICELQNVRSGGPIALSARGEFAAVCSAEGLRFFDATSGEEFPNSQPTLKAVNDLLFLPVGRCVAVATLEGVRFFEPLTGLELLRRIDCPQGAVRCLATNRDGTLLATGGADSTVLLWNIRRATSDGITSYEERLPLLPSQREMLWADLAGTDAATGLAASSAFLDGGKASVAFFRDRLLTHQTPVGDSEQRQLLKQLADPDYRERAKAFVGLKATGRSAESMLREALRTEQDEIMRLRLRTFLRELEAEGVVTSKDNKVRETRVIQLLELMDTSAARELLDDLKKSAAEPLPKPTEMTEPLSREDALGDPLPPGAVMRLGSARWRHGEPISVIACSKDGKRLASASRDDAWVRIWDAESGEMLHKVKLPAVKEMALSEDGKSLAVIVRTVSADGSGICLWKEGTEKARQLANKTEQAGCLLVHEGQLWIGSPRGIVCWDLERDRELREYRHETPTIVTALAYYGGAKPLVAAATENGVLVIKTAGEKYDAHISEKGIATAVAFAPDGESVAVGTDRGSVYVWEINDKKLLLEYDVRPNAIGVTSLAYSSDGKQLISVNHAGECYRWASATGKKLSQATVKGATPLTGSATRTSVLVLSSNGQRVAGRIGGKSDEVDRRLHVWDTTNGDELSLRATGHGGALRKMAFQADGSFLSFTATDELILWNAKFERASCRQLSNQKTGTSAALSNEGRVVVFPQDLGVELDSLNDLARPEQLSTKKEKLYCAAFSPGANRLVTTHHGSLGFWSLNDGSVDKVALDRAWAYSLAFSGNGERLVLSDGAVVKSWDSAVQVWSVASRTKICDLNSAQSEGPLALSPRGQIVALWSTKGRLQFFDGRTGEEFPTEPVHLRAVNDLAFTPDGRYLIAATEDAVRFFEPLTGREVFRFDAGQGAVQCLAIKQDGSLLATGGIDSTVLIWDLRRILRTGVVSPDVRLPASAEQREILRADLVSTDATTSFAAVRSFVEGGQGSIAFLRDRLLTHETPLGDAEQRRLLKQLADPDYKERAKAFVALKTMARQAELMLRGALLAEKDEIMRLRLRTFLGELEDQGIITPKDERIRDRRVVQLLELMDTPEAQKLQDDLKKSTAEPLPKPTEMTEPLPRADALGDPLPAGAVARMGSMRWRHGDLVSAVAYSHDGKRLASASWGDASVCIWDAESGKPLHKIKLSTVSARALSALALSEDGKSLAAVAPDASGKDLSVWVWKEGAEAPRELLKQAVQASCLLFQDGKLWVGETGRISCWDIDRGNKIYALTIAPPTRVNALALSHGAVPILAVATGKGVIVIDTAGKEVVATTAREENATAVAISNDGGSVAVGTDDGEINVWSLRDKALRDRVNWSAHKTGVTSLIYSSDGKQLISVCHAGELYRWDVATRKQVSKIVAKGAPPRPSNASSTPALVLSPDGKRLAGRFGKGASETDSQLHVWDTANGEELSRYAGHSRAVSKMAFQSDGSFLSFSVTGEVILWNSKHEPDVRRESSPEREGKSAALSNHGRVVVYPSPRGLFVDDVKHPVEVESWSKKANLYFAIFSPDPNLLLTTQYGSLGFWSIEDRSVDEVDLDRKWAYSMALSGDGTRLILIVEGGSKETDTTVQVWDVASRKKLRDLKNVQSHGPIALSANGRIAAVWDTKGRLRRFDTDTGQEFAGGNENGKVPNDLVFTPDGRSLMVGAEDGVRFLEPLTGRELFRLDGGQGAVKCLALNRDGTLLATGGADSTILLWDLRRVLRNGLASQEERMPLFSEQRETLWVQLASTDPTTSFQAAETLMNGGKASVAFLRAHLLTKKQPMMGDAEQRRLLKQLADPDYKERAKAFVALKKLGRQVEPMLREALRTEKDEIMHLRLRTFLRELEADGFVAAEDDRIREMRIVQLLEWMDTPAAHELLRDLKKSPAEELPRPTEVTEPPALGDGRSDPLPPGAVLRLGSAGWRHGEIVRAVAYSQDGKRLASAGVDDEWVVIWDAESGKMLSRVSLKPVTGLALSEDGKSLAVFTHDLWGDAVWVWKEGMEKPRELIRRTEDGRSLLFHKRQLWLAERTGISSWDLESGKILIDYRFKTQARVTALAYHDGERPMVAAAMATGVLLITPTGVKIAEGSIAKKESATTVAFAPDGKSVAVGTDDGALYVWAIKEGTLEKRLDFRPHRAGVTSITYSPDGKELISASQAGECCRWNALSGEKVAKVIVNGAPPIAADAAFTPALVLSPDGKRLAGRFPPEQGKVDHHLHVWDTANGEQLSLAASTGHGSAVLKMAFQSDGSFVSLSITGEILHWETRRGDVIRRELLPQENLSSTALSREGRVAFCFDNTGIEVYDLRKSTRPVVFTDKKQAIYGAAFSPDPNLFVTAYMHSLGLWSVKDRSVTEVDVPEISGPISLAFSRDGKRLVLADKRVRVWDLASRKIICEVKNLSSEGPVALSTHSSLAALYTTKGELYFFDATNGQEFPLSTAKWKGVNDLVFAPNAHCLVVATGDGVHFLEPISGRELIGPIDGGQRAVTSLVFNRDGTLLATGGADGTVLFWDVQRLGLISAGGPLPLLPAQRESLWNDLASTNPAVSYSAFSVFYDSGKASVAFFRDRLLTHEKPLGDAEQQRLLKQLADPDYKERAKAFAALKKIGQAAEPMLREAYRIEQDEIMHLRLRAFLSELEVDGIITSKDERTRDRRIVQVLGLMGTPSARELLSDLAQKATSEPLREDAREAFQRLKGLDRKE
jgi:WD40 repeat protein